MLWLTKVRLLVGEPSLKRFPFYLLLLAGALTGVGALFIWSAHSQSLALKHLIFAGIGVGVFLAVAALDYRHLSTLCVPLYLAGLMSLALLPVFGKTVNNARRWYDLGPVSVQPSEGMKFLVILLLAEYLRHGRRLERLRDLVPALVIIGVPMLLIASQPDVGTAIMFVPTFFAMAFIAGVRTRNLVLLVAAGCVAAGAAWFTPGVLKDYQRERVLAFVAPEGVEGSNAASHGQQAIRAIQAGGLRGEGWGRGVINQRGLLSERHTDFIFVVIAEEWGFYRTAGVVLLYLLLVVVLSLLTLLTRDRFGRLLAAGVTAMIAFQGLVNMAIAVRLAPITGLTLPFISYGGSSLISVYAALGLVASVFMRPSKAWVDEEE